MLTIADEGRRKVGRPPKLADKICGQPLIHISNPEGG